MTENSRVIASQDLTTAGFYDMADEWSTSRKIEKYGAFRTRDSYVEASSISDLVNGDKVIVTWADQGTHPSTIGDVGSNAGNTPNSGYYVYNSGLQKLVRTAPLEIEIVQTPSRGTTLQRPSGWGTTGVGRSYFDTTLGKPIWWNGSGWVDGTGSAV